MKTKYLSIAILSCLCFFGCGETSTLERQASGMIATSLEEVEFEDFFFDTEGYVWLRPSSGRYIYKTDGSISIKYNSSQEDPGSLSSDTVNDAEIDRDGVVWIATQKGVDRYNSKTMCFEHIKVDDTNNYIISIAAGETGRLCIATRRYILEYEDGRFAKRIQTPFMTSTEPQIFFDSNDHLWARYDNLLLCYDSNFRLLFRKEYEDLQGKLVSSGGRFVYLIDKGRLYAVNIFSFVESAVSELFRDMPARSVSSMAVVEKGKIVVNSTEESQYLLDEFAGKVLSRNECDKRTQLFMDCLSRGAEAVKFGPNGNLWSVGDGLGYNHYMFDTETVPSDTDYTSLLAAPGTLCASNSNFSWVLSGDRLYSFDREEDCLLSEIDLSDFVSYRFRGLSASDDGKVLLYAAPRSAHPVAVVETLPSGKMNFVKNIRLPYAGIAALDAGGEIYAAGMGTRIMKVENGSEVKEITSVFNDYTCYASLIKCLSDGTVLICWTDHNPVIYNPESGRVNILTGENLNQVYFAYASEDKHGKLWLGATDKGLYAYDMARGTFGRQEDCPFSTVNGIASDSEGNIFVLGDFDTVYLFPDGDASAERLVWKDYSDLPKDRALFMLPDGSVVLAGDELVWFNSERLNSSLRLDIPIHVVLTSGKSILYSFTTRDYPENSIKIKLNRRTEALSMHIGVVDKRNAYASYSYYYDINGFKTGPRESFDNHQIPLYGVTSPFNRVLFWVTDNNHFAATKPFVIRMRMNFMPMEIMAPLALAILALVAVTLLVNYRRKKKEAIEERLKREMTEKMNLQNIDFFANISHEFRTPLSLIKGASTSLDGVDVKLSGIIKRNTDRMLKLVSQMLEFNKLDHGMLKLNVKLGSVEDILETVKSDFEVGASIKGIQLLLRMDPPSMMGWIDRDKLEKILYNLCSNAIRYTPAGGSICIDAEEKDGKLTVSVSDTGIGIPDDAMEAVFERFYQTDNARKAGGSGIGLYYTKALVNLHHGEIGVAHRMEDGKVAGSVFTFVIPVSEADYSQEEKAEDTDNSVVVARKQDYSEYVIDSQPDGNNSDGRASVMIIDDDYEIVYYLKNLLSDRYRVFFRFDAMSGYKMIEEVHPDAIICDMMMLEVDGIQLCHMVKENESMTHIPFIMLTAKATKQDQIDSLGAGADAYVVKPFDPDYLTALLKSLIDNRARMRKMINSSTTLPASSDDTMSAVDREFMEKMYDIMKESLSHGELDIESVAESLGVSRSKFYYKVKGLTGQTPNEFFTTYKLNYSLEMLKEGKYKISAISDILGFSSASHFAAQFKKQFGMSPSQYLNH